MARRNPTNLVKTAADERRWSKAKRIAAQSGRPDNYAYIVGIYKCMNAQETKPMRNPTHAILTTPVPKGGRARTSTERKKLNAAIDRRPVHSRAIVVQASGSEFYGHVYSPYHRGDGYFSEDIRVTTINRRPKRNPRNPISETKEAFIRRYYDLITVLTQSRQYLGAGKYTPLTKKGRAAANQLQQMIEAHYGWATIASDMWEQDQQLQRVLYNNPKRRKRNRR